MPQQDNIISFGSHGVGRRPSMDANTQQTIKECRDVLTRTLPQLLSGFFEKLDDALYELADKSDSNSLQTAYFEAMREVRKERSQVTTIFQDSVVNGFDCFWKDGPAVLVAAVEDDGLLDAELALVEDDELEETLAVNNLISKGENRYHRELYALSQRFGHITKVVEVDNHNNPLGPLVLCRSFRNAMQELVVDTPVKLVIYKLFDKQVMHYIGGLYDELNSLLGKAGVIPKLTPKLRRNPVAPAISRTSQGSPTSEYPGYINEELDGSLAGSIGDVPAEQLFSTLQQLLGQVRGVQRSTTVASSGAVRLIDSSELLIALSALQQSSAPVAAYAEEVSPALVDLRGHLSHALNLEEGNDNKILGQVDDDTIDVVSMLFEFILEDNNLPDAMKALIGRLQIPVLKVAILDKSFFSKKLHPARRLLNSLAQAAVSWTDDGDRSELSLYGRVESIVKRILNEFDDDPSLFCELGEQLADYLEQEQRNAKIAEERTAQVNRGKEQLKTAKQLVSEEIDRRLKDKEDLPEVIQVLLNEAWKDVLLLTYLRQGSKSIEWTNNLDLVDRLLWSVRPKSDYQDRQELLRHIPDLLKKLREGLTGISYDQHKMARLFKELQSCHIGCLRGSMIDASRNSDTMRVVGAEKKLSQQDSVATSSRESDAGADDNGLLEEGAEEVVAAVEQGDNDDQPEQTADTPQDEFVAQAAGMPLGTWLELKADDTPMRIKLSWRSDVSDAYMFVNRKGVKVVEMTLNGLAMVLRRGDAKILAEVNVPIMDRALKAMMKALKKTDDSA